MRTSIFILALLLIVSMGFAGERTLGLRGHTNGTAWTNYDYTNSLSDTSQAIPMKDAIVSSLMVHARDSAKVYVSFMPSYDGATFFAKVTVDSLVSTANGGAVKGFAIPEGYKGCSAVKWVLDFQAAGNGVTSDSVNCKVVQKLDK